MKKLLFLFALNVFVLKTFSQNQHGCSSHIYYQEQLKNNPEFRKNQELLEKETAEFIKNNPASRSATTAPYIIPIVFHIIHTGGSGNISDAQVIDQVQILNKEFPRMQADTVLTPGPFKQYAAGLNVEFRLATIDPNGNCTSGIDRVYNSLSNCSVQQDDVKALSYWPSTKYLNIWLVQSMHYSGSTTCNGGGYATFPGGAANLDGVNIRGDLISNIGTAATNSGWGNFKGRYLVHELGHWFNLRHIWGDANCGNDFVADTPPHVIDNSGCPSFPHNPNNSCGGGPNGEMFTDYMDYTNGPCLNMFTAGQVARMTAALNSSASGKNNLWTTANLIATGTADPYIYPANCVATPDFLPYGPIMACVGDSVKFTDYSYGGLSTSRQWNFSGNPASSLTDSIVKVKYTTAGVYSVSLTKNYLSANKTVTTNNKVYVLNSAVNPNYTFPVVESFENVNTFNNDWITVNKNNDVATWKNVDTTSYTGARCISISNFGAYAPSTDDLISPVYDLSATNTNTLSFRLQATNTSTANTDKLEVSVSFDNCALTWYPVYTKSGTTLKTIPANQTSPYTPSVGTTEWRLEKINLDDQYLSNSVRFKFSFTSGGGNNIFIDDININGINTVGIKNNFINAVIKVFPNPANEMVNIAYTLKNKAAVQLEVIDVLGKVCSSQTVDRINEGENTTTLNTSALNAGVYFIRMKQNGAVIYNFKFVKQGS